MPDQPGLRPTSDRLRETLFNWLAPMVEGARCLDLFAGSGALGFEAASRGAREVLMLERSEPVARVLESNVRLLGAGEVRVEHADAMTRIARPGTPFDIVFLDPPFGDGLLGPACALLEANGWLGGRAFVYLEASLREPFPALPPRWDILRDKQAGQVRYALAMAQPPRAPPD